MTGRSARRVRAFALSGAVVLAAAQLSSYLVQAHLSLYETHVVNAFVHLTHVRNTGAVFGLFPGNSAVFIFTSSLTIAAICLYVWRNDALDTIQTACFGVIAGAAAGNLTDRIVYGAVIDFIDLQGIPYWRYVFNTADVAIHVGVWPLVLSGLFGRPDGSDRATTPPAGPSPPNTPASGA
jgi:signal peptidase II